MDVTRRGFLGAAAAATGWLVIGKPKSVKGADPVAPKANRIVSERDEDWDGLPVRIIELELAYDDPMLFFDEPPPTRTAGRWEKPLTGVERSVTRRMVVPRQNAETLEAYTQRPIAAALRDSMRRMRDRLTPVIGTPTPLFGTVIAIRSPHRTEYGICTTPFKLTSAGMYLTAPASTVCRGIPSGA